MFRYIPVAVLSILGQSLTSYAQTETPTDSPTDSPNSNILLYTAIAGGILVLIMLFWCLHAYARAQREQEKKAQQATTVQAQTQNLKPIAPPRAPVPLSDPPPPHQETAPAIDTIFESNERDSVFGSANPMMSLGLSESNPLHDLPPATRTAPRAKAKRTTLALDGTHIDIADDEDDDHELQLTAFERLEKLELGEEYAPSAPAQAAVPVPLARKPSVYTAGKPRRFQPQARNAIIVESAEARPAPAPAPPPPPVAPPAAALPPPPPAAPPRPMPPKRE